FMLVHRLAVVGDELRRVRPLGRKTEEHLVRLLQNERRANAAQPRTHNRVAIANQRLHGDLVGCRRTASNNAAQQAEEARDANAHRSISPNTTSSEPRMAVMSASMWPRERKSIAWRCG